MFFNKSKLNIHQCFPPSAVIWGSIRVLLLAAKEREKAYDLIENCLETIQHVLGRLKLSLSASEVSFPLRTVYLSILVKVLEVFAIVTTYVRRGGFSMFTC
jgi:hypothetical protein